MAYALYPQHLRRWVWLVGLLGCVSLAAQQDGNGVYTGSDTIPNNTVSTVENNFGIGAIQSLNDARGTYLWWNRSSQRLSLVTQGLVTLGDPNEQGLFPSWLEVNSQSGGIRSYARADMLFQVDTFFYSLRKGGLQLPDNVFETPFLLQGDVGMLYFNRGIGRLAIWDGEQHRNIAFSNDRRLEYEVVTSAMALGSDVAELLYLKPDEDNMEVQLPPLAAVDGREITIKNISLTRSVRIVAHVSDAINITETSIEIAPNTGVRLHSMTDSWQTLGSF